jgi:3-deoxy-manno-octulosonate cytidylyltransferase (CMP-KDO synthetase)
MPATMETVIVIPARYESSRFPGKPLAPVRGKPMIGCVIERALMVPGVSRVAVATDDERIAECARSFKGEVVMTRPDLRSGTDRVAEAARLMGIAQETLVVNVQGDQPLLPVEAVADLINRHRGHPAWPMSTLIYRIANPSEITDPRHVKTVFDSAGRALYFSRSPVPFYRDDDSDQPYYKHLGIYAYARPFLETFSSLPTGRLEAAEKLEQLRALEYGYSIRVVETPLDSFEVDTPQDLGLIPA